MDTISALVIIFGAAFAWIVLTVYALKRLRRRKDQRKEARDAPAAGAP